MDFYSNSSKLARHSASALVYSLWLSDDARCESGKGVGRMRTVRKEEGRSRQVRFGQCDSRLS